MRLRLRFLSGLLPGLMGVSLAASPLAASAQILDRSVHEPSPAVKAEEVAQTQSPAPTPLNPSEPDYELMARVLQRQFSNHAYLTESRTRFDQKADGEEEIIFLSQTRTITAQLNQFRAEIQFFGSKGELGQAYLVVGDGQQVWVWNRDRNQYSVMTAEAFLNAKTSLMIGGTASFVLMLQEQFGQAEQLAHLSTSEIASRLESLLSEVPDERLDFSSLELKGRTIETVGVIWDQSGTSIRMGLDGETSGIKFMAMHGPKSSSTLNMSETVVRRLALASLPEDTFVFVAPEGAEQVAEAIELNP